eukprot:g4765.t1
MAKANVELPGFTDNPMVTSVETDSDEDSSSSDDSNSGEVASYLSSRRRKNRQKIRRKKKNAVIRAYRKYNELLVLIFEACFRAHGMAGFLWKHQPVSKDKRDAQITVDVCVDTIFIFAPFLVWDGTKFRIMRFTLGEMLSLTAIPSISLFSKLRKNIKETILNHADQIATRLERKDTKLSTVPAIA